MKVHVHLYALEPDEQGELVLDVDEDACYSDDYGEYKQFGITLDDGRFLEIRVSGTKETKETKEATRHV